MQREPRKKLSHEAFTELNDHMINMFYARFEHLTWYGFNLLAIDDTLFFSENMSWLLGITG